MTVRQRDERGIRGGVLYNLSSIDTDDEVIPGLNWYFCIVVSDALETIHSIAIPRARRRAVRVET